MVRLGLLVYFLITRGMSVSRMRNFFTNVSLFLTFHCSYCRTLHQLPVTTTLCEKNHNKNGTMKFLALHWIAWLPWLWLHWLPWLLPWLPWPKKSRKPGSLWEPPWRPRGKTSWESLGAPSSLGTPGSPWEPSGAPGNPWELLEAPGSPLGLPGEPPLETPGNS